MDQEQLGYKIKALRHKFCQMCLGNNDACYKPMCRKKGDIHDCKPQAMLDELEEWHGNKKK